MSVCLGGDSSAGAEASDWDEEELGDGSERGRDRLNVRREQDEDEVERRRSCREVFICPVKQISDERRSNDDAM